MLFNVTATEAALFWGYEQSNFYKIVAIKNFIFLFMSIFSFVIILLWLGLHVLFLF